MSVTNARRALRLVLVPLVAACASLTSTTSIDPGKAFRLGGGQPGAFVVRGTNMGPVPVIVYSEVAGKRDSLATAAPGQRIEAQFPKSAMAVFTNTSTSRTAVVAITVTGDTRSLAMTYEANAKR
jgi:hypothetical protein